MKSIADRFWAKVSKTDSCWHWTGSRNALGYGRFWLDGANVMAHRASYELAHGPIGPGLTIDHLCRTTSCVNPSHLEPVTIWANVLRTDNPVAAGSRATECQHGHEFTAANTGWKVSKAGRNPHRFCRACRAEYVADLRRRKRQSGLKVS